MLQLVCLSAVCFAPALSTPMSGAGLVHSESSQLMGVPGLVSYFADFEAVAEENATTISIDDASNNPMVVQVQLPTTTSTLHSAYSVYGVLQRLLEWDTAEYDARFSQFSQDSLSAKTASFWFVSACSNSFAVAFGIKAILFGVHPKFYFSKLMVRSIAFHIIVGSLEFAWMMFMYLSVPCYLYSVVLAVLDSVQNVTIWLQMRNSSGSKFVTNACYLYCMWVKAGLDVLLLLRAPFSRDLVFAIYFILSAFTFTRLAGMPYKWLGLFKGMVYTAAVFTATMITASMAFGTLGPFSLWFFLMCYTVYAKRVKKVHRRTLAVETKWDSVSQRNPFAFTKQGPTKLMRRTAAAAADEQGPCAARIVFDVIAECEDAQQINMEQLARLLCPSGVVMAEVEKSFAELKAMGGDKAEGIHFDVFRKQLPSVWQWYYDYMVEAVANHDAQQATN